MFFEPPHIIPVDQRSAGSAHNNTDGEWDEHQSGLSSRVSFTFLINDRKPARCQVNSRYVMHGHLRNEEHVQQSVQNTHVQRDQENNQLSK